MTANHLLETLSIEGNLMVKRLRQGDQSNPDELLMDVFQCHLINLPFRDRRQRGTSKEYMKEWKQPMEILADQRNKKEASENNIISAPRNLWRQSPWRNKLSEIIKFIQNVTRLPVNKFTNISIDDMSNST
jgi:hypothetical protein